MLSMLYGMVHCMALSKYNTFGECSTVRESGSGSVYNNNINLKLLNNTNQMKELIDIQLVVRFYNHVSH